MNKNRYTLTILKKLSKFFVLIMLCMFCLQVFALDDSSSKIELGLIKDRMRQFHNRTYVYATSSDIIPIGSEIIKINNVKIKNKSLSEINKMLKDGCIISLLVKKPDKSKQLYNFKKISTDGNKIVADSRFDVHWKQIVPPDAEICDDIPEAVLDKLSYDYSRYLKYWVDRKILFQNGYNACLSYLPNEQNMCLMNLVNREIDKTKSDKNAEMQAIIIYQQEMIRHENFMNQIRTQNELMNIDNSIRQINQKLKN